MEADRHNVTSNLYHLLKPFADELEIPGDISEDMRRAYYLVAARNIGLFQDLSTLLHEFDRAGIPAALLKGVHLADEIYGNIALRSMCDVDLLARQSDLPAIDRIMRRSGAKPLDRRRVVGTDNKHFAYRLGGDGLLVEVHWALMIDVPHPIGWEDVAPRLRAVKAASAEATALCPEDLLLHLCLHTARDIINRPVIRMLCDLDAVTRRYENELDWPVLVERARTWHVSRAAYVMLFLAREWLGAPVPEETMELMRPENLDERVIEEITVRFFDDASHAVSRLPVSAANVWETFWRTPGFRAKRSYLEKLFFVSPEIMASKYGAPPDSWRRILFYPARLLDLLRRYGGAFLRLTVGRSRIRGVAHEAATRSTAAENLHDWLLEKENKTGGDQCGFQKNQ